MQDPASSVPPFPARRSDWVLLALVYGVLLLFCYGAGLDVPRMPRYFHTLEPAWVWAQPVGSFLALHSTPPLFNVHHALFSLPTLGGNPDPWLVVFHALGGLLATWALFAMALVLVPRRWFGWLMVLWMLLNPAFWLYLDYYFYTFGGFVLVMLAGGVLTRREWGWGESLVFFGLCAALVLLISSFHPIWYAAVGLALAWQLRWPRHVLAAWALWGVPIFLWCLKNMILFGSFGLSTWGGMNLVNGFEQELAAFEAREHAASVVGFFRPIERYGYTLEDVPQHFEHADFILSQPATVEFYKSDGKPNYNHVLFILASRDIAADMVQLFRAHPALYARKVYNGLLGLVDPMSSYLYLTEQPPAIEAWRQHYNLWFNGTWIGNLPPFRGRTLLDHLNYFMLLMPVGVGLFIWAFARLGVREGFRSQRARLLVFWILSVGIVSALILLVDGNEGTRLRQPVAAGFHLMLAWGVLQLEPLRRRLKLE